MKEKILNAACEYLATKNGQKLVLLDIGADGGPERPAFKYLLKNNLITYVGIEPQKALCDNLAKVFPHGIFVDRALGNKDDVSELNITKSLSCSSVLKPNFDLLSKYPIGHFFQVTDQSNVELSRADTLIRNQIIPNPHFIKCDVQGYDYEVLEGFGDYLSEVLAIEVECHFKQLYLNQKLFFDIKCLLESFGFILRDIRPQGIFENEIIEINAFFSKQRGEKLKDLDAILLWEFASEIKDNVTQSLAEVNRNLLKDIFSQEQKERLRYL